LAVGICTRTVRGLKKDESKNGVFELLR